MNSNVQLDQIISEHYEGLYRFALGVCGNAAESADMVQEAVERLLRNPSQLRDPAKAKTWLFTTVYRLFLQQRRHVTRFPHIHLDEAPLPSVDADVESRVDAVTVAQALEQIEEPFRAALVLFYLKDHSYREIAEILDIPVGTVMSRISRGKALLRALLADRSEKIIPLPLEAAS